MRFSIAMCFTALLGMGASLPTGPNLADIEMALHDAATNFTANSTHSTEDIDAAMFGLLRDLVDATAATLRSRGTGGPPVCPRRQGRGQNR